jgi:RimJ/RimL family protein N-acetyltransferase
MSVPTEIRTARLLMRPWSRQDAEHLLPVLTTNRDHLAPWIPARVAEPAPVAALAARLGGFAADFEADREWRYAIVGLEDGRLLGEVSLFPRSADGRVRYVEADRGEIGYWLRADMTGRGLATEAAQAMLDVASTLPALSVVEIRCDARNAASAAVPRRLGFALSATLDDPRCASQPDKPPAPVQVWTRALPKATPADS